MDKPAVRDGSLLLFRFVLGIIFVAHGFDKFFVQGLTATGQQFAAWGVPQAQLSAYLAATAEFVGGLFLTVGLLTTIVAGILALLMVAAFYLVHMNAGFFIAGGGDLCAYGAVVREGCAPGSQRVAATSDYLRRRRITTGA